MKYRIEILEKVKNKILQSKRLIQLLYKDLRVNCFGQTFPIKPHTLNLLVNDICNSKCQMCSIWKRKRDKEFTPKELAEILRDSLFSNLRYVGVSGGEPTLRKDLPEIFRVIANKKPPILGTGIITNAIIKDDVISKILSSAKLCREANVPFNIMVSLDGIGEIHDKVRGRRGNFNSAVAVIRHFRDYTDIPISIGCTITKDNVWYVDDVLDLCLKEGVYVHFRIAEFIRRLYNFDQGYYVRNFSKQEAYHLGLFFAKLEYTYETFPKIKRTYRNIRRMLIGSSERSIKCPWQAEEVTLDCRGHLFYCAPRSPSLGSCLEQSAEKLYIENIEKRRTIVKSYCKNCIHDYHADETVREWLQDRKDRFWRWQLSLDKSLSKVNSIENRIIPRHIFHYSYKASRFLIIGWYGTETAGDKAILGEVIYQIQKKNPKSQIVLASLYPYLSSRTLLEIGYPSIKIIPVYSVSFWQHSRIADEVILGGGPLMHLEELGYVLRAFELSKKAGNRTRIMGCGIGPLDRGQRYKEAVKQILLLSDVIELRDSESVNWASQETGREDIINSGDYAVGFVQRWMKHQQRSTTGSFLNLYLRKWTEEYQGEMTHGQFKEMKVRFEMQLGKWIHKLCNKLNLQPRLLPMHHFCIGGDDRDFNRRFAQIHLSDLDVTVEKTPLSIQEILASMHEASLSLCMRFHSVLFANTLGVPFYAIDYTGGGKIYNYLLDHGCLDRMINVKDIASGKWPFKLTAK